jgi:amino acid transporter
MAETDLKRVLTFQDLVLFGISSIVGTGGFNLIGDGIISGGNKFPVALAFISSLFQGTSYVYQQLYNDFKTNTAESDIIKQELGGIASNISIPMILISDLISVSTILVISSKLLFPNGTWSGQISFALILLSMMTTSSIYGIEVDKDIIVLSGLGITALLSFASLVGLIELREGFPKTLPSALNANPNLIHSTLYFFFVLAGFNALVKFTEEVKDPDHDLSRSFYASNAISTLLTVGVCFAFLVVIKGHSFKPDDNILAKIVGTILGEGAQQFTGLLSIALTLVSGFISFLAATRYMYGLGKKIPFLAPLQEVNQASAPWKAIAASTLIIAIGILNNHVYQLVKVCDITIIITLLLVSAAVSRSKITKGKVPWIEGLTTLGLGGLLSAATLYK